jgi:hypothetical protein
MFKLFVVTFITGNSQATTEVISYERQDNADRAARLLLAAAGSSFAVSVIKLYHD